MIHSSLLVSITGRLTSFTGILASFTGTLVLLFTLLAGCEAREDPSATAHENSSPPVTEDPSPSALAEPPTEDAAEAEAPPDSSETIERYSELMAYARGAQLHERPIGEILQELGLQFVGRPYIVGPLDGFGREVLICRLDRFDCFTFLEAMLAAARGVAVEDYSWDSYVRKTTEQRYRDGEMGDYCTRLHYYTEWIYDNEQKGIVRNITAELGGERLDKRYGFMSAHRGEYAPLESDSIYRCIRDVEDRLNEVIDYYYIPQNRIHEAYDGLQPGDLIATSTDIEGLDVTHTGMVYKGDDGSTGLLHASTNGGVKISPDLQEYVQGVRVQTGIIVARAAEPDQQ